jgi:UDP-N-acetylmuramate dehydrogenase
VSDGRWFEENRAAFTGELLANEPLSRHTYYRIGGPARFVAFPRSPSDLAWLSRGIAETGCAQMVLGSGSNILVSDEGFDGLIIRASRLDIEISAQEEESGLFVRTGAGVAVSTLLRRAAREGWGGLEFLTGVPGSIGGVVAMNAGTHLGEAKDHLTEVLAYDLDTGKELRFAGEKLRFEYRRNLFLPAAAIVVSALWRVVSRPREEVQKLIDEALARRKSTQPIDLPSCGSVFKNPRAAGKHAWQVLDQLGLRGHRIGDAQISEKHSNFIVNLGKASASEVRALIELAKKRARAELSIELEEEVRFVGNFPA